MQLFTKIPIQSFNRQRKGRPNATPRLGHNTSMNTLPSTPYTARLEPSGLRFGVGVDQTLLDAADAARIQLPRSCRNGTCRTCICRVVSGTVVHTIPWPGLLPEEKSAGYILPCVAQPMSNVVLDHPTAIAL